MNIEDPAVSAFLRRTRVARLATLSASGRPSITPLYFVYVQGHLWLGTADWTLAARQVKADPRVCVLFQIERDRDTHDQRVLRIQGSATVQTDATTLRASNLRMALKYILTPGSLLNRLAHRRQLRAVRLYHAQNAEKGRPCVIDITPTHAEFLDDY